MAAWPSTDATLSWTPRPEECGPVYGHSWRVVVDINLAVLNDIDFTSAEVTDNPIGALWEIGLQDIDHQNPDGGIGQMTINGGALKGVIPKLDATDKANVTFSLIDPDTGEQADFDAAGLGRVEGVGDPTYTYTIELIGKMA